MKTNDALATLASPLEQSPALICTKCGHSKSIGDFYTKGQRRDSRCKGCMSKIKKARYRVMSKVKARSKSDGTLFSSAVIGRVGETAIEGFSSVIAESIQGLMDEGKI